jgi:hypothetical protein
MSMCVRCLCCEARGRIETLRAHAPELRAAGLLHSAVCASHVRVPCARHCDPGHEWTRQRAHSGSWARGGGARVQAAWRSYPELSRIPRSHGLIEKPRLSDIEEPPRPIFRTGRDSASLGGRLVPTISSQVPAIVAKIVSVFLRVRHVPLTVPLILPQFLSVLLRRRFVAVLPVGLDVCTVLFDVSGVLAARG